MRNVIGSGRGLVRIRSKLFLTYCERVFDDGAEKLFSKHNSDEAAQMLIDGDNTGSLKGAEELVKKSQEFLSAKYIDDADSWGVIDPERWNAFYKWLYENKLCDKDLTGIGFSNDYLPQ